MRICILANAMAVHTRRWAKAFVEHGHEVHVLSIRKLDIPGVKTHTVHIGPVNTESIIWTFLSYCYLLLSARYHLRKLKPDIVNAHYVLTHGVIAAFTNYHPLVITAWGSDVVWHRSKTMPWYLRFAIQYVLKRADLICAASKFLVGQVEAFAGPGKSVKRIPFGVDCQLFRPTDNKIFPKRVKEFRIGFVKTLSFIYGPDVLIKAMPKILQEIPEARLIMAGQNRMGDISQKLATELSLADKIEFMGFVENSRLPELIQSFDVFVNPSVCRESFGVSVLEASACAVPVVASRIGGLPDVCIDGQTGILFEPNSPEALAKAIIQLAKNPELRQNMGQAGRKLVIEKYNWQNNVEETLKLFEQQINTD